jgi:hypothetical protein
MLALTKKILKRYLGTDLDIESERVDALIFAGTGTSTLTIGKVKPGANG